MSLVLGGCCREIISNGFHGDVVSNNKRSLMMISSSSSSTEKKQNYNHLSCFTVDPSLSSSDDSDKSSIGGNSDDDLDLDDEYTSSTKVKFSMESLEESLPIKRGLSNFFAGRSKSFANLSEATTVKSLAKTENPFNKRRRTLMACRRSNSSRRRKTFYRESIISPVSMPLLKLNEDDEEEENETDDDDDEQQVKMKEKNNTNKDDDDDEEVELKDQIVQHGHGRIKRFKAPRCFSLTDLHHHHHSPPLAKNV